MAGTGGRDDKTGSEARRTARRTHRASSRLAALAAFPGAATLLRPQTAGAAEAAPAPAALVIVDARIGARPLSSGTRSNPIAIDPHVRETLSMTVRNIGDSPGQVRFLRLSGSLLSVHFVHYEASVNVDVPPGETRTISVPGDFFDVDGVARGYVNASMQLVDQQRAPLATQRFVADVRGKVVSSVGFLFLEALAFALISIVDIIIGLYRRKLPRNRFVRAVLFALATSSTVVTIVIGAAMFRVALFATTTWVPAVLISAAIGFVLGYLSPGRVVRTSRDIADDKVLDLAAADAVARASGQFDADAINVAGPDTASHESGDHSEIAARLTGDTTPSSHESGSHEPLQ